MSSDQIAYLRELALSHHNEGNYSASIAAWQQILALDPSNAEAKQGVTLAQMQMQGVAPPSGGGQDPDATMMFSASDAGGFGASSGPFGAGFGAPAAPAGGGFDADRTMVFQPGAAAPPAAPAGGFDAEKTMVFGAGGFGAPAPAPAAPAGGGFDAEKTMVFGAGGFAPPAPAPSPFGAPAAPAGGGGFDADRTVVFSPSASPPAAPPAGGFDGNRTMAFNPSLAPPPAPAGGADWLKPATPAAPEADMTVMSPPSAPSFDMPVPPSPFGAGKPAAPAKGPADFALPPPPSFDLPPAPGGGLPPPPGMGGGMTPPPASSGFSFELPPPPAKGGGMGLPDLPSVGLSAPPPFTPAPPVAPPAGPPKKAAGQFGEVDPGEIASLSVPTVAPPKQGEEPLDEAGKKEREERLRQQYEQQYGRSPSSTPQAPPKTTTPSRPAVSKKSLAIIGTVLVVVLGGGFAGIQWWLSRAPEYVPPTQDPDPDKNLSKDQAEAKVNQKIADASRLIQEGKLEDAKASLASARDIALKAGIPIPPTVTVTGDELQREEQFKAAFDGAVRSFCFEDYPKANSAFVELELQRPDKKEIGKYIELIFWNLAVEQLQQKQPWEASYYLDLLVQRNPGDAEARKLLEYSKKFGPADELGDAYLDVVDPLQTRMAGCK